MTALPNTPHGPNLKLLVMISWKKQIIQKNTLAIYSQNVYCRCEFLM